MATTPNNLKITKDSAQVIVGLERVTENWTKALTLIPIQMSTGEQGIDEGAKETKILDLLMKAERRFTFDGSISDSMRTRIELPTYPSGRYGNKDINGDAITDATDILNTMRQIFFAGGVFTLNWDGNDHTANCDKFESKWVANDKDTITAYDVKFTVVVGGNLT